MKKNNGLSRALQALPTALLFGFFAMAAGYIIPNIYFRYFDNTVYYKIENPLAIEMRDYRACDFVDVYIVRTSLIDGQGDSIINLSLIRDDTNNRERISAETRRISISKGDGTIITHWQLPCTIEPGEYFFEGTVKYQVRGFDKYTHFYTQSFLVGVDGEVDAN